ncbi:MAG: hypothetical protein ACNA78_01285 [Balneolaceae bacterium]
MNYRIFPILFLSVFMAVSCSDAPLQQAAESVDFISFSVTPEQISITDAASADTSLTLQLRAETAEPSTVPIFYLISRNGQNIATGELISQNGNVFTAEFTLTVPTRVRANYNLFAFIENPAISTSAETVLRVLGTELEPPVLLEVSNPDTVQIPDSGNRRIDFFARVMHPDGQELIDRVLFFIIDQNGARLGDEFRMFDDGIINLPEGRIDETAGDSLFSRALFINEQNNPDETTVFYYALGVDGQSSDTLQAPLIIVQE